MDAESEYLAEFQMRRSSAVQQLYKDKYDDKLKSYTCIDDYITKDKTIESVIPENITSSAALFVPMVKYSFPAIKKDGHPYSLDGKTKLIYPRYIKYCKKGDEENEFSKEELDYIKKVQLEYLSVY
jgi:hypothetical protein